MELGVGKARVNCVGRGRHGVARVRGNWVGTPRDELCGRTRPKPNSRALTLKPEPEP